MPYNLTGYNVIKGTPDGESITGTILNDAIYGKGGPDFLNGGLGADVLFGGDGGVTFSYSVDGVWGPASSINSGDPGYPGTGTTFPITGYGQSHDVFVGMGSNNTLVMPDGKNALFLDDSLSPSADAIRLVNIQTIIAGNGGQIIDLTSTVATYGDVTIIGGKGDDILMSNGGADVIRAGDGNDYAWGGSGNDKIDGGAGDDTLLGANGDDFIDGGAGNDAMTGGAGNDTFVVDAAGDTVTESSGQGTDAVVASVNYTLGGNVENLTLTGSALSGTGNSLANVITGNSGDNTLDGAAGNDTMIGGAGNDTYVVDATGDGIVENAGEGTDLVRASASFTLSANVENLTLTGSGNINGTGNGLDNVITGNTGANVLDGGAGNDTMIGGTGSDTYVVDTAGDVIVENAGEGTDLVRASFSYTLGANLENLTLIGSGNINGTGNSLNNILTGNSGDNVLDGGAGNDQMIGGAGNDSYIVGSSGDSVVETAGQGTDTVVSSLTYTLGANVENLTLTGSANLNGNGNALDNVITGTSGNNTLDGGAGNDTLLGGAGNDTYTVDATNDAIVENAGEGTDLVRAAASYTLSANLENLTLTGTAGINGAGNASDNLILGNTGNNVLDGGAGNDTLTGGAGNDTYVVDSAGDVVVESASQGTDTVQSSLTYTLAANVENLTLIGSGHINGTGNAVANVMTGNAGNNVLDGGAGVDTLAGGAGNDTYLVDTSDVVVENANEGTDLVRASFNYTLGANVENLTLIGTASLNGTGNALDNVIIGTSGANVLDGGAGVDTLIGGAGNDTYMIDNSADVVVENAGEGTDLVNASVSYVLSADIENLTLTGTVSINGTGNASNNIITGNTGDNLLDGGGGNDTLLGGDGNDWLDGGLGNDAMSGGAGNDTYAVDSAGDLVTENLNQGTDLVRSFITYTLTANVENLTLMGLDALNGTGNGLDNKIIGNVAANVITGGAGLDVVNAGNGNDTIYGGDGNDSMFGEDGNDSIYGGDGIDNLNGGSGTDTLIGGEGNDGLWGGGANDLLVGENGNDKLYGDGGNDLIYGGAGDDWMTGGQLKNGFSVGNDVFGWARADVLNANGTRAGYDTIVDFGSGDRLDFSGFFSGQPAAPIHDLVRVTDAAGGTVVSLAIDNAGHFMDMLILKDVHGLGLDDLIDQHAITV